MKRGTKLFLVDADGNSVGPFKCIHVRGWFAQSFLSLDSWISVCGEEEWKPLRDFEDLQTLPASHLSGGIREIDLGAKDLYHEPATTEQIVYLRRLGCPFSPSLLSQKQADVVIGELSADFPDRVNPAIQATRVHDQTLKNDEAQRKADWRNHPATQPQIDCLRARGLPIEEGLTKGRASVLIDGEATDAQRRRLTFYGIDSSELLTKNEASQIIDSYIAAHPTSEELYQSWKAQDGIACGKKAHPIPRNRDYRSADYVNSIALAGRAIMNPRAKPHGVPLYQIIAALGVGGAVVLAVSWAVSQVRSL